MRTRCGGLRAGRASWIVLDQCTQVVPAANHLAGLRILNYDILGEDLIKVFGVAPIQRRDKPFEQGSVVDMVCS